MSMNKKDVIHLLEKIATYLELKGENPFKVSAYRKAAQALERDERSLTDIDDFTQLSGIGKGTGAVINEYIKEGKSETLEILEKEVPSGLISLLDVPGLGGKRIATLYKQLGVTDRDTLKLAIQNGQVERLPGFGKKMCKNILQSLEEINKQPERLPIAIMLPVAEKIGLFLQTIPEINQYSIAGSLRRMKETIKDIDFIIATNHFEKVIEKLLTYEHIKKVVSKGDTKVSLILTDIYDISVDFRIVKPNEFATTLHHFTGSKKHNVAMRQLAKSRGEKINEYGVEIEQSGEIKTFDHEEQFFHHFGLPHIPPELRENHGELEQFHSNYQLITSEDIRGDLHLHTTWSDGAQSIEEMVNYARKLGYDYIAITDHSKYLRVANGLNEERLRRQREEIYRLNEKYDDIHIFAGVEMDILSDGSLDFSNLFLKEMDLVIAAIHSSFNQSEEKIMYRLYSALENPYVHIIAHPTGRLIGRRKGYSVNIEKLIQRAKETSTVLEINANPNRLDLPYSWARIAQEEGVILAINTDAHRYNMYSHIDYGVRTARKGWIKKDTVLNTWKKDKLVHFLSK